MNDSVRVRHRPRRAWRRPARTAAVLIATAALALLAAACSGSPSSAGSGGSPHPGRSATSPSAVAYSACIRSHGVPNFPDPGSNGQVPKADPQLLGASSSQLQMAQRACQQLYPANGGTLSASSLRQCYESGICRQALVQQALSAGLRFAQCMRLPRSAELARPHHRFPGAPSFQYRGTGRPRLRPRSRFPRFPASRAWGADQYQDRPMRAPGARRLAAGVGVRPRVAFGICPTDHELRWIVCRSETRSCRDLPVRLRCCWPGIAGSPHGSTTRAGASPACC